MPGELRWGILACGYISSDFVTALRKCVNPNVVVAAAASSLERAQQFCERLVPKAKAYGTYEELLADKDIGADRWASIVLQFPGGGHALLYYNGTVNTPNTAFVSFDKGIIQIPEWFWCTTKLVKIIGAPRSGATNAETLDFPLNDDAEYNFNNSSGLHYEADHVYECITNGKTESDIMPLEESLNVAELVEEVRRQLGVVYPQDHH